MSLNNTEITPPSDGEKYLYIKANRLQLYSFGIVSVLSLVTGMWLFTLAHPSFHWFALFALLITFYLSISYIIGIFGKEFDFNKHIFILEKFSGKNETIDVYLPSCGEDINIIENTYKHVAKLEGYSNIKVYVLDDAGKEEVEKLAEKYGFTYISRPNKGELKKAGNMRYAFTRTNGEYIVVFDADFAPRPDFLKELMPYFSYDEKIAIVQSPQFFEIKPDQFWVEKGAAYIQELFYRLIQVNRDYYEGPICVGTNAIYKRKALEPFGGTAAIGYSEDVHTGFNVISQGWKVKYVPINLAKGVCPSSMSGFFIQQYRWAMGSITLFFNSFFWKTKLTVMQRVCYLSGMLYYIATGLSIFVSFIPSLLLIIFLPEKIYWYNAFFSVPSFIFGTVYLALWTKAKFGMYSLKVRQISYYSHLFALIDKLRGNLVSWVPTGAKTKVERFNTFKEVLFFWNLFLLVMITAGIAYRIHDYHFYNFIPAAFFSLFNTWLALTVLKDQTED